MPAECHECPNCERLQRLLTINGLLEQVAIWHVGNGSPDVVRISLSADGVTPVTGMGSTLGDALSDLERQIEANHGL